MFFKSVAKIEIGACGASGAMGTSLTDYRSLLNSKSFKLNLPKPTTKYRAYIDGDNAPAVSKNGRPDPLTLSFELMKLNTAYLSEFLGGEVSDSVYEHGVERVTVERSVKITGDMENGKQFCIEIPRASIAAGIEGGASEDDESIVVLTAECEALIPFDADGNKLKPWRVYDAVAAAASE